MTFLLPLTVPRPSSSAVFKSPPLDGSLTVPELYDWHLDHNPRHRVFVHPDNLAGLTFSDVVPAVHRAGWYISNTIAHNADAGNASEVFGRPVVAILAACDTITYLTTLVGAMRAGITVHPISPRFSAAVVAHLLAETRASHVFIGVETELRRTAEGAIQLLRNSGRFTPEILSVPTYVELYDSNVAVPRLPPLQGDYSSAVLIVHSSGSTSYPKPIVWNSRTLLQNCLAPLLGNHDLNGTVFGCHAVELFHAMGLFYINWIVSAGITMSTFQPSSPAVKPTPESMFQCLLETGPSYILAPPIFIRAWAIDPAKVQFLSHRKGLMFGGRNLSKPVGDHLARAGVPIYTVYGMTEIGLISAMLPANRGLDWEYFEINPHAATEISDRGDGTYEMMAISKSTHELTLTNTSTSDGENAYSTGDIFSKHPTRPGQYKVIGRADDQIMLSTGDIIDPYPLEDYLTQHPRISATVVFGRGRSTCGVLVEPEADSADFINGPEFQDIIWPEVQRMNESAPGPFARISREMILIAHPDKKFTYNAKGVPRRAAILKAHELEIDALYDAFTSRQIWKSSTPIVHL